MRGSRRAEASQRTISVKQAYLELTALELKISEQIGIPLVEPQLLVSKAIFKACLFGGNFEIPLLWCRRFGKTEMLITTAITLGVYWIWRRCENFLIGLSNPARNEQSIMVTKLRLQERLATLGPWLELNYGITKILGDGRKTPDYILRSTAGAECQIRAISADPSAHQKGAGFHLQLLEQVEEMDETTMKTVLFPMATGMELQSCQVLAGTPSMEILNGYYRDRTRLLKYPYLVDYRTATHFRPSYGAWVEMEKERLGEDSEEFRTQYGCEWIALRNKLIEREALLLLAKKHEPNPENLRFTGTDVAKLVDRTICTLYERSGAELIIIDWLELEGTDYEEQADDIVEFTEHNNVAVNCVDVRGPGLVLADMLRKRGSTEIQEFMETPKSNNEMYTIYERELRHRRLRYIAHVEGEPEERTRCRKRFIEEHVDAERHFKNNLLKVEAPNKKGVHDDYVASGALGVFAAIGPKEHRRDVDVGTAARREI